MVPHHALPRDGSFAADATPDAITRRWIDALRTAAAPRGALGVLALFVGWALCSPFFEIDHSSLIYSGRMLAEFDPAGVGRDAMYRYDGQSGFTVFTGLNVALVAVMGLAAATTAISIASVVCAFAGAATLATAIVQGRTRVLAILFAATFPACYGGYKLFSYAETAATPRPFAEALVLCGVAALVRGRLRWAACAMSGAAILHPILALPGLVLLMVWLVIADRRWLIAFAALGAISAVAVLMHLPLFERLTVQIDPDWKAILDGRNPHLFPSLWPEGWKGRAAARIATLLVAASLTRGAVRLTLLLTLAVGVGGFALAYMLNERAPIVLLIQAQTWRATWLMFAIAPMAAAICTLRMWTGGGTRRIALALLALSWIFADYDQVALLLAGAALAFHVCVDPAHKVMSTRSTAAFLTVAAVLAIGGFGLSEWQIVRMTRDAPTGYAEEARRILALDWDYTPLAAVAALVVVWKRALSAATVAALTLAGTLLLVATWDRRSAQARDFDAGVGMPELARVIETRPGDVFWLGGVQESWRWLGRPNWVSPIQGAGLVFSRPLAMLYRDRARRAAEAGLDDGTLLTPNDETHAARRPLEAEKLDRFCAAPDAPAWVVAPSIDGVALPAGTKTTRWSLPHASLTIEAAADGPARWRWISRVDVMACAAP